MAADAVRAGGLGELVFATWRFGGEPGTSSHPHANLIETQCHGLDMLEYLCGPIDSVTAQMTDKTGRGYSTLVATLHFANGAVGSLVGSYDSSYAYPATHWLELNGTSGRILVEDTVRRYTFTQAGSEVSSVWQAGYFNDADRGFHRTFDKHVDDLLPAFRNGQAPPIHARAGRRALAVALAIIDSFETGTRVDVPRARTPQEVEPVLRRTCSILPPMEGHRPRPDRRGLDGLRTAGQDRAEGQPARAGLHELRRPHDHRRAPLVPG